MSDATIESLSIEISASSTDASANLDKLATSLENLRGKATGISLGQLPSSLRKLNESLAQFNSSSKLTELSTALSGLKSVGEVKISSAIGNQIERINQVLGTMDESSFTKLTQLSTALSGFDKSVQISSSIGTGIEKIATALKGIDDSAIGKINRLAEAFSKLSSSTTDIKGKFSGMSGSLSSANRAIERSGEAAERASNKHARFAVTLGSVVAVGKMLSSALASVITQSNKYVEDLNLFTVALGEYSEEAKEYAENVSEIMGIDPAQWMRNQGMFMTLADGFGVASDRAYTMSKNLTQLGYDISSFYNIGVEEAMTKLQSGISGQLKPLRSLGYDLSQARLQQEAYNLGIEKSVTAMSQAEKSELRYYTIMTQVTQAQGDMSRTLETPANQLRILQAQFTQCARAIGDVFIPMLNAILPVVIAVTKVVRILAATIASLFGYSLPSIDYSGLSAGASGAEEIADDMESAAGSAKKMKNYLLGIDELNILPDDSSSGGGSGSGGGGDDGFSFDLPEYDFLGDAVSSKVSLIVDELKEWLGLSEDIDTVWDFLETRAGRIVTAVTLIGTGMASWAIGSAVLDFINKLTTIPGLKTAVGLTITITGVALSFETGMEIGKDLANGDGLGLGEIISSVLGIAAAGVGGFLLGGTTGMAIGITVAIAAEIAGIVLSYNKQKVENDFKSRFGDLHLDSDTIAKLVEDQFDGGITVPLDMYIDLHTEMESFTKSIDSEAKTLSQYAQKIQLGVALSEDDIEGLKTTFSSYVSDLQDYIDTRDEALMIAVKLGLGEDSETGESLIANNLVISSMMKSTLSDLGTQFNELINNSFTDGLLDIDVQKEAQELISQITELRQIVTAAENASEWSVFNAQFSFSEFDESTWNEYKTQLLARRDELRTEAEQLVKDTETSLRVNIGYLQWEIEQGRNVEENQKLLDQAEADLQTWLDSNPLDAEITQIDIQIADNILSKLSGAFSPETTAMTTVVSDISKYFSEAVSKGLEFGDLSFEGGGTSFMTQFMGYLNSELGSIQLDPALASKIQSEIDELLPKKEYLMSKASEYREAGEQIPKEISDGLSDIYLLEALAGNVDSFYALISAELTGSEAFYTLLSDANLVGAKLPDEMSAGINSNVTAVYDAANDQIVFFKDGVQDAILDATPQLRENMSALGIELTGEFGTGVTSSVGSGTFSQPLRKAFSKPESLMRSVLGMDSGTPVFKKLGTDTSSEYTSGLESEMSNSQSTITTWAKNIKSWFEGSGSGSLEGKFRKTGTSSVTGYVSGIENSTSQSSNAISTWAKDIISKFTTGDNGISKDKFGTFAKNAIGGFKDSVTSSAKNVLTTISTFASDITKSLKSDVSSDKWKTLASDAIEGLSTGFSLTEGIKKTISSLASTITSTFTGSVSSSVFEGYAKNTVDGYNRGIQNKMNETNTIMSRWASNASTSFKDSMMIASPSKLFRSFGMYTIEGYNDGIKKYSDSTEQIMTNWAESVADIAGSIDYAIDTETAKFADGSNFAKGVSANVRASASISADGVAREITDSMGESDKEQNDLLRQQNELLRQILDKTGIDIDGKKLTNTVNMYQASLARARG